MMPHRCPDFSPAQMKAVGEWMARNQQLLPNPESGRSMIFMCHWDLLRMIAAGSGVL